MNRKRWAATAGALAAALATAGVLAQQGGDYRFELFSIPGGGGSSSAAGYTIEGAFGQPMAGQIEGSGFIIDGGFFGGGIGDQTFELFAPNLISQP